MRTKVFRIIRIVLIIVCIGIIVYEAVGLYRDQKEYNIADNEYDEIRDTVIDGSDKTTVTPKEYDKKTYPVLNIDFDRLHSINEDVVAWLYIPCLKISYPVVKETEINEYLYKTFDGTHNKAGCLFEDILSDENFCGMHDIIFGHNMKDKSMFGSLKTLYQSGNEHLLEDDPYIYIYTKDNIYKYRVFAYYITEVGSDAYSIVSTNEEYDDFVKYIRSRSIYDLPGEVSFDNRDSILTLSTCSGQAGGTKRFVVHTIKVSSWVK